MNEKTILICATSNRYLSEAEKLIDSIRQIHGSMLEIVLYTDCKEYINPQVDKILLIDNPTYSFADKVFAIKDFDADQVLFLDTDVELLDSIMELFDLLEHFDLAAAHAPNRYTYVFENIPKCFPELNTGVLLYRSTDRVKRFMDSWYEVYLSYLQDGLYMPSGDQPTFRELLFSSNLRFTVLTPEYNCRFGMGSLITDSVKILHGRIDNMQHVKEHINHGPGYRWGDEPGSRYVHYRNPIEKSVHLNKGQSIVVKDADSHIVENYESKISTLEENYQSLKSDLQEIKRSKKWRIGNTLVNLFNKLTFQKV